MGQGLEINDFTKVIGKVRLSFADQFAGRVRVRLGICLFDQSGDEHRDT